MKNLFALVAVCGMLVACGGSATENTENTESAACEQTCTQAAEAAAPDSTAAAPAEEAPAAQ